VGRPDQFTDDKMDNKSPAPSMEEMTAVEATVIQGGFTIPDINAERKTEDLLEALKRNRGRLKELKDEYVKVVKDDGGVANKPSSKRRMVYHEILRMYGAMEGLKNELTQRGANFEFDFNDQEHPNAAFKRLTAEPVKSNSFGFLFWYLLFSVLFLLFWFFTSNEWKQMLHFPQERSTSLRPGR
jgi:hypothetical protein